MLASRPPTKRTIPGVSCKGTDAILDKEPEARSPDPSRTGVSDPRVCCTQLTPKASTQGIGASCYTQHW